MLNDKPSSFLLSLIVFAQFAGTSLWFAGNAVIGSLSSKFAIDIASITSTVQFGFISGTLCYALLGIPDRFNTSLVFFVSTILASLCNALVIVVDNVTVLYTLRFATGFFLAGIYPVGMKIAADLFPDKLGKALGFLVGALVLGTAFPHLIRSFTETLSFETVILTVSALAITGGLLIWYFVPGRRPLHLVKKPRFIAAIENFRMVSFRQAALGYFGHMWELYTFWAFVPILIHNYNISRNENLPIAFWSFVIIASGFVSCSICGMVAQRIGSKKVAFGSLFLSFICCLLSPLVLNFSTSLFILFLIIWGFFVVADSPQFSALIAKNAEPEIKGTALTLSTCLGFFITIFSLSIFQGLYNQFSQNTFLILALGPFLGLAALLMKQDKNVQPQHFVAH